MSHFAKVRDGKVIQVIVADPEFFNNFIDDSAGTWIQTSYNTRGGVHYKPDSNEPSADQSKALRGNYAGLGYIYDQVNDVFYDVQPFPSWTLNTTRWEWECPVSYPNDGKSYTWDEPTIQWVEVVWSDSDNKWIKKT